MSPRKPSSYCRLSSTSHTLGARRQDWVLGTMVFVLHRDAQMSRYNERYQSKSHSPGLFSGGFLSRVLQDALSVSGTRTHNSLSRSQMNLPIFLLQKICCMRLIKGGAKWNMEQVTGFEPVSSAWQAEILAIILYLRFIWYLHSRHRSQWHLRWQMELTMESGAGNRSRTCNLLICS